ncbi:MAG: GGDEF domain-containing protein [Chitinivorax sp.]
MSASETTGQYGYLPRQKLRIRRWLMASSFYVVGVPFVLYGWRQGQMAPFASATFVLMATLGNLLLYWQFATGRNNRYADPSLTVPQMLLAIVSTLIFTGGASASLRPTVSLGLLAPLIFGCFQLQQKQLLRLALFAIAGYGLMLLTVELASGLNSPVVEVVHWGGLSLMLGAFVAICGEITRMRDRQRQLSAQLQESADRDPLTGLYNRRWLLRHLPQVLELAQRHQRPYCACMLDVDHFKLINDRHGHLVGDSALQWVAEQISRHLRKTDSLVRVGGEEFLLLLPETPLHGAHELAERICQHLAQHPFAPAYESPLSVTVSIGVAQLHRGDSIDSLINNADNAMYLAKQQGRSRVVLAGL